MNPSTDPVQDRIESAERMLREARVDCRNGRKEDAQEFLRAAARHIAKAIEASEAAAPVVNLRDHPALPMQAARKPAEGNAHAR